MESIHKKKGNTYSAEFKAGAVSLVLEEGQVQEQVSRNLGIASSTLSKWLKDAREGKSNQPQSELTPHEQRELAQLRKEVRTLRMEREILKKAAAFFAKEST